MPSGPKAIDPDLIALGIRQPWAELILRGIKTIEVRSQATATRGTILIYASKKLSDLPAAREAADRYDIDLDSLPMGLLVGTVEIVDSIPCRSSDSEAACVPASLLKSQHGWRLANPKRFTTPAAVRFLPYGVWFYPFKRRKEER
jgi:hypothetical protein